MSSASERLAELNPEALVLEPRSVYDQALVDVTNTPDDHWPRKNPSPYVGVYDYDLAVKALAEDWGGAPTDFEQAHEWIQYNSMGAWVGDGTPTWRFNEE